MRKVVTGDQVAQIYNRDPFALPAWRAPVFRTPFVLVLIVQVNRVPVAPGPVPDPPHRGDPDRSCLGAGLAGGRHGRAYRPGPERRRGPGGVAVAVPRLVLPGGSVLRPGPGGGPVITGAGGAR